jgi:hypothetical protein
MARLLARFLFVAVSAFTAAACSSDSPSSPSRQPAPERPAPSFPPLAEGRYRLHVSALGSSMGCEITAAGVPLGGLPPVAGGSFAQDVQLRQGQGGWTIAPDSVDGRTTLALLVNDGSWPASPVVTGIFAGQSDQRAYDGPAIDAGERDRPTAFTVAVMPGTVPIEGIVLSGTVSGRLTFSASWTGQVTVCRSAQLVLQQP